MSTLEQLTGKEYLSYSSLSTYVKCGEEYRLSRIEKVPEAPAYWFPGGSAVHKGTEVYDLLRELDGLSHGEALEAAIKGFHNEFSFQMMQSEERSDGMEWRAGGRRTAKQPNGEDAAWWRQDGPIQVKQYADWRVSNPAWVLAKVNDVPAVEVPFDVTLGDVKVRGFIDRIFATPIGEYAVVDLKSGKMTPADYTQLAIYATALDKLGLGRPRYGSYFMTRTATMTPPADLLRFNEEMLGTWLGKAKLGIENGIFLPHVTSMCGTCSVANFCYAKNPNVPMPDLNMTQESS